MELGIIGLATSGKTTIFNALTGSNLPTLAASLGKLELHRATVAVPDHRLAQLSELYHPQKTIHAQVTYIDIAGLEKDIGKEGLSGPLRNQIATMDAFVHVVRAFESNCVPHPLGNVDPQRDLTLLHNEMLLADLLTVEKRLTNIAAQLQKGAQRSARPALLAEQELFQQLRTTLEEERPLRSLELGAHERETIAGYGLLSLKPVLVLLNTGDDVIPPAELVTYNYPQTRLMSLRGQLELEISQLPEDEVELFMEEFEISEPVRQRVIRRSYELIGLISFFTVGADEVRAWNLKRGESALDAAATIHTDLARGFIRAEVLPYQELLAIGNLNAARQEGLLQLEGKDYIVQDGEIVHIRFSI
ncbi:MAG TPA: redox-regulated ATPase YchF [Thermoflexia bacterium]|nr:redox-regulated ATPase YchF [Thermoflexia bacterium]